MSTKIKITEFNDYQEKASVTDTFEKTSSILDPGVLEKILGVAGEAGEVADKFKKIIRDKNGKVSNEDKEQIAKELGDVLWYLAGIARYLDIPFNQIAEQNIEKLYSRMKRGKLAGDGDNR